MTQVKPGPMARRADVGRAAEMDRRVAVTGRGLAQQTNQLGGQQDSEKRNKNAGSRVSKLAPGGTLKDHFLTLTKNYSDNRLLMQNSVHRGAGGGI